MYLVEEMWVAGLVNGWNKYVVGLSFSYVHMTSMYNEMIKYCRPHNVTMLNLDLFWYVSLLFFQMLLADKHTSDSDSIVNGDSTLSSSHGRDSLEQGMGPESPHFWITFTLLWLLQKEQLCLCFKGRNFDVRKSGHFLLVRCSLPRCLGGMMSLPDKGRMWSGRMYLLRAPLPVSFM